MIPKVKKQIAPAAIVVGGVVLGAIVLAQSGHKAVTHKTAASSVELSSAPGISVTKDQGRKSLAYYTGGVRTDMFGVPLPPPAVKPKVDKKPVLPTPAPAPVDPFADYAYTGTVLINNNTMALIENSKTKQGDYYGIGDSFIGGKITQIGDRMVTVKVAGRDQNLAKSDDYKLLPLDKSAPFLTNTGQGQPGAPGMPGAPGANGQANPSQMPGFNNLPQQVRDRIMNMTPEERASRRNRWMNGQFDNTGRGGGRGGFGGGGFGGG